MNFKRILSVTALVLCFVMIAVASGCKKNKSDNSSDTAKPDYIGTKVNLGCLKGQSAVPLAKLTYDAASKNTENEYAVAFYDSEADIRTAFFNGDIDIATVSLDVAADMYANGENADSEDEDTVKPMIMGVKSCFGLWIAENGDTVKSFEDLKGKSLGVAVQNSCNDYILRFILRIKKINADEDISVQYFDSEQALCEALVSGAVQTALISEYGVSPALSTENGTVIKKQINIADEWRALRETQLPEFCFIVNSSFAKNRYDAVNKCLEEFELSAEYAVSKADKNAELCGKYGIADVLTAESVSKCINPTIIKGGDMYKTAVAYYGVLLSFDYTKYGKSQPSKDFYFK